MENPFLKYTQKQENPFLKYTQVTPESQMKAANFSDEEIKRQLGGVEADPWVDPVTAGVAGFGAGIPSIARGVVSGGLKEGAKALGKAALGSAVDVATEPVVGQATEYVAKKYPHLALPFNIAFGTFTSMKAQGKAEELLARFAKEKLGVESADELTKVSQEIETNLTKGNLDDPKTQEFVNYVSKQGEQVTERTPQKNPFLKYTEPIQKDVATVQERMQPPSIEELRQKNVERFGEKLPKDSDTHLAMIDEAAQRQGVDPDLARAIYHREYVPDPKDPDGLGKNSSAGAVGPMQLMPGAAKDMGVNRFDVKENIQGGVKYLKWIENTLTDKLGRTPSNEEIAAAYHDGVGNFLEHGITKDRPKTFDYAKQVGDELANPLANEKGAIGITGQGWGESVDKFMNPFKNMPEGQKYLVERGKAKGQAARGRQFAENLHKNLMDNFSEDSRRKLFYYADGKLDASALTPQELRMGNRLKSIFRGAGQTLYEEGLLHSWEPDYMPYLYERYLAEGKGNDYWKQKGKLTDERRAELGFVDDAAVASGVGLHKSLQDISTARFYRKVASNPNWTWTPEKVAVDGKPYSMQALNEEIDAYQKLVKNNPDNGAYESYLNKLMSAKAEVGNPPSDWKQMPSGRQWGSLSGQYVQPQIYDDIVPIMQKYEKDGWSRWVKVMNKGMSLFKLGNVALNLTTAARNVVSNVAQLNLSGMPLQDVFTGIYDAAKSMKNKDKFFKLAQKHGLFETNMSKAEIEDVLKEFKTVNSLESLLAKISNLGRFYGKIDDISKLVKFKHELNNGAKLSDAFFEAQKWGMDYSVAPRFIKGARSSVLPFVTYPYKIAPLIAEAAKKNPWVFAKYAAIPVGLTAWTMAKYKLSDEDYQGLMKELPSYIRNNGYQIIPMKSPEGHWQWVNLNYFFPWGQFAEAGRNLKNGASPAEWARTAGLSNPYLNMIYGIFSTVKNGVPKDPFSGQAIFDPELDDNGTKITKTINFLWNQFAPSMIGDLPSIAQDTLTGSDTAQGFSALGYTKKYLEGKKDKYGRRVTLPQAALRWGGVNIVTPVEEQRKSEMAAKAFDLLGRVRSRISNHPNMSEEEKIKVGKKFFEYIQRLQRGED